jgi:hypothetical protein
MKQALPALILIAFVVSGCTSLRRIDSQVQRFAPATSSATAQACTHARYDFARLPSQQTAAQDALEAMAQDALAAVGMQRAPTASPAPACSVEVALTERSVWDAPDGVGMPSLLGPRGHWAMGGPLFAGLGQRRLYQRELHLVMRERATGQVVFEARVANENPWSDTSAIVPALLQAALQDPGSAGAGVRTVAIDIPR